MLLFYGYVYVIVDIAGRSMQTLYWAFHIYTEFTCAFAVTSSLQDKHILYWPPHLSILPGPLSFVSLPPEAR